MKLFNLKTEYDLEINQKEIIFLDSIINFTIINFLEKIQFFVFENENEHIFYAKNLIDKVSNALNLSKKYPKAKINLILNELDLYVLREIINVHDVNYDDFKINLKNNIYNILFKINKIKPIDELINESEINWKGN